MNLKKKSFIILSISIGLVAVFTTIWYLQGKKYNEIFTHISERKFDSAEKQVGEKIFRLLKETKENPDSAGHWGKLGINLYIHNYKDLSILCFKRAHQLEESDFRWAYFCAIALEEQNSNEAIGWYERSRILKPDYPPLNVKLGNRYLLTGQAELARPVFKAIIDANLNVPHAHLGIAKIEIESGNLAAAKNHLLRALEQAPRYREAHALLAEVWRREGDRTQAEEIFGKMAGLPERLDLADPIYYQMVEEGVSSFWCQVRGNNLLKAGKTLPAEKEFKKALIAKPNQSSYTSLGYVYQLQKKYDDAIHQYESALKLDPNYAEAINNLAIIYFEKGDVEKAITMLEESLQIHPESIDGYLNLGTFYKHKKSFQKSVYYFDQGLKRAPTDHRFAYQLAWLYSSCPSDSIRNGKEAVRLAEFLCKAQNYNHAPSLDVLAAAYAEDGQFTRAIETGQKARQLASTRGKQKLSEDIKKRIDLFRIKKAYREN